MALFFNKVLESDLTYLFNIKYCQKHEWYLIIKDDHVRHQARNLPV